MRLFSRRNNFIKTNPNDKPKVRYEKVLLHRLEKEGYRYLKSKNMFVQDFEYGRREINLSYNSSFGYISQVQYFSHIIFSDLEKAFKQVYPKYGWTNWTIHENHHWTKSWMCNSETGEYTDKSINNLADEFFKEIKPEIDKIFSKYLDYKSLIKAYNANPNEYVEHLPIRIEKRIINGLLLERTFNPKNYELLKSKYLLLTEDIEGWQADEQKKEIIEGIDSIEKENIVILSKYQGGDRRS